ncbi:hypothetical protein ScPMuIL_005334 [Solemya velum]
MDGSRVLLWFFICVTGFHGGSGVCDENEIRRCVDDHFGGISTIFNHDNIDDVCRRMSGYGACVEPYISGCTLGQTELLSGFWNKTMNFACVTHRQELATFHQCIAGAAAQEGSLHCTSVANQRYSTNTDAGTCRYE